MPIKRVILALVIIFAMWPFKYFAGASDRLIIPESMTIIDKEAFAGDTVITSVSLPEGLEEIGVRAFADTKLYSINMPESITFISPDAFEGIATPLLFETVSGSASIRYALDNNLDFRADTVCRALLVGQSNYPSPYNLTGPIKDIANMSRLLSADYDVTIRQDLSVGQIISAISKTFRKATDVDISLFYYSGHGLSSSEPDRNGSLVGIDYTSYISATELRNALDSVPGRKIVVIDACYSGGLIGRGAEEENARIKATTVEDFSKDRSKDQNEPAGMAPAFSFIQAFSAPYHGLYRSLAAQQYFVLVSSSGMEISWETRDGGVFTNAFIESRTSGDLNCDNVVTLLECYTYSAKKVRAVTADNDLVQSVEVYPEDCYWFGMFR